LGNTDLDISIIRWHLSA